MSNATKTSAAALPSKKDDALSLSGNEKRVLELYDRLQQLQLETALMRARNGFVPSASSSGSQAVEVAQKALLESRARYVLRNDIVEGVLTANPILQAAHNGMNASPIEKDLEPAISERDASSISLAQQSTSLRNTLVELTEAEAKGLRISRENVDLATQLLSLAAEANRDKDRQPEDLEQAEEITRLEREVKASRQRWRIMKGTASAVVAGSGVDWVRDPELRDLVLDPADADEF